jgi:hypothetical protein
MPRKKQEVPEDCMPKCANCAFFDIEPKDDLGYCRRFPPTWAADENGSGFSFPALAPVEWCGEFKRRTS